MGISKEEVGQRNQPGVGQFQVGEGDRESCLWKSVAAGQHMKYKNTNFIKK